VAVVRTPWRQCGGASAASPAGGGVATGLALTPVRQGRILPDHGREYSCHGPARFGPRRAGHRCGCAVRAPGCLCRAAGSGTGSIDHRGDERRAVALSVSPFGRSRSPPCRSFSPGRFWSCVLSRRSAFPGGTVGADPAGRSRPGPGPRRADRLRRPPGPVGSGWCRSPRWVSEPAAVSGWESAAMSPSNSACSSSGSAQTSSANTECRSAGAQTGRSGASQASAG